MSNRHLSVLENTEVNIFVLDHDVSKIAEYQCDSHATKMCLETCQLLCTAHHVLDESNEDNRFLYKKTHVNHPCSKWVRNNSANYQWTFDLFHAIALEYEYRYGRQHLSWKKLAGVLMKQPNNITQSNELSPFALAMPDQYKTDDPVESYRNYYLGEKRHLFRWKNRNQPEWIYN